MAAITPQTVTFGSITGDAVKSTEDNFREIGTWLGGFRAEKAHTDVVTVHIRKAGIKPADGVVETRALSADLVEEFHYVIGDYVVKSGDGAFVMSEQLYNLLSDAAESDAGTASEPTPEPEPQA